MTKIRNIAIILIMIGLIGVAFNLLFGTNTVSFISQYKNNTTGIIYYKYDFQGYIFNIQRNFNNPSELRLVWQTRTWVNITSNITQQQFWTDLGNNMAYILNVVIFALNIILYPIRISMYVGRMALSLMGINLTDTGGGLYWLVDTANYLITLQIPYV